MDYDICKPGDNGSAEDHDKKVCTAAVIFLPGSVPFGCTRPAGHMGQHVAEGTSLVLAVWQVMGA